jgi:hypothetical protein
MSIAMPIRACAVRADLKRPICFRLKSLQPSLRSHPHELSHCLRLDQKECHCAVRGHYEESECGNNYDFNCEYYPIKDKWIHRIANGPTSVMETTVYTPPTNVESAIQTIVCFLPEEECLIETTWLNMRHSGLVVLRRPAFQPFDNGHGHTRSCACGGVCENSHCRILLVGQHGIDLPVQIKCGQPNGRDRPRLSNAMNTIFRLLDLSRCPIAIQQNYL